MAFLYSNDALTTLSVGVSTTQTILYLASGAGALFPTPTNGDVFSVTLKNSAGTKTEVCWCNYRSGDALTVLRAQEGSAANTWSAGDLVSCGPTAGTMQSLQPNIASGSTSLTLSNNGLQQWGLSTTYNLVIDNLRLQARFNGIAATLTLNPLGGIVNTAHVTLDDGFGNVSLPAALTVAGTTTLNGATNTQALTATGLTVNGNSTVNGTSYLNGTVNATGNVICAAATASNQATTLSQFASNIVTDGYTYLPNGLILQWGYFSNLPPSTPMNFPIAFPNACFNIVATLAYYSPAQGFLINIVSRLQWEFGAGANASMYWTAIGY